MEVRIKSIWLKVLSFLLSLAIVCKSLISVISLGRMPYPRQQFAGTLIADSSVVVSLAVAQATLDAVSFGEHLFTAASTMAGVVLLKKLVNKERPDKSNCNSFPSGHAAKVF